MAAAISPCSCITRESFAGRFIRCGGVYTITSDSEEHRQVLIEQKDLSQIPPCADDLLESTWNRGIHEDFEPIKPSSLIVQRRKDSVEVGSEPVDVLVVYTPSVENLAEGPEQVQAYIENEIAKTNQVLENSDLPNRQVRLAGIWKRSTMFTAAENLVALIIRNLLRQTSADNYKRF